ncbi:hypothetical protein SDC9_211864 [bioreactor metagenome]|uniref:Uncharacterized protein n=1 Tax=bioreactor metagenome TaxID=1076179 RepID=A0A645JYB2_9ZZZZ
MQVGHAVPDFTHAGQGFVGEDQAQTLRTVASFPECCGVVLQDWGQQACITGKRFHHEGDFRRRSASLLHGLHDQLQDIRTGKALQLLGSDAGLLAPRLHKVFDWAGIL